MKKPLSRAKIQAVLDAENVSAHITVFDTIDSTNVYLKRNITKSTTTGTTVIAGAQTHGRGRLGRSFYSPENTGLYMSVVFRAEDIADVSLITIAASTAVCKAIEVLCGAVPQIKWVNDIFLNGKKVCGILAEAVTDPQTNQIDAVIAGIGVNISTSDFPEELSEVAGSLGGGISREALAAAILERLIPECVNTSDEKIIDYYQEHLMLTGKEVRYTLNGKECSGTVRGIDKCGRLIVLRRDGNTDFLKSGEVSLGSKNFSKN